MSHPKIYLSSSSRKNVNLRMFQLKFNHKYRVLMNKKKKTTVKLLKKNRIFKEGLSVYTVLKS